MKIIDDTLKGPNGKWSRKSLTTFVMVIMTCATGIFIVVSDWFLPDPKSINQYAIAVFFGFAGKAGFDLYLTMKDKMAKFGGSGSDE